MNRRKGVIAILAGVCAAYTRGQSFNSSIPTLELTLQKGDASTGMMLNCKPVEGKGTSIGLVSCDKGIIPQPKYAIVVHYGDRTVKLSAQEIMDALEGK